MAYDYFYYDGAAPAHAPDDPRTCFGPRTDGLLASVLQTPPGQCRYADLCARWSSELVNAAIRMGLFRIADSIVYLDSPVFIQEDLPALSGCFQAPVARMADALLACKTDFLRIVQPLRNGFSPEINLYHLLCGAVLDGTMFTALGQQGIVATSRRRPSGRDYLLIVYERCPSLERFSNVLLCSYNRLSDGRCSLQSFGDANGLRTDAYRFAQLYQAEQVPPFMAHLIPLWEKLPREQGAQALLEAAASLALAGHCSQEALALLTAFGYAADGRFTVPVYRKEHQRILAELTDLACRLVFPTLSQALSRPLPLLCCRHHVPLKEIANETYHILFGQLNEALIQSGMVARPLHHPEQGRYLQSVQLF